ncbi:MAG: glycoside hydrolase family 97 catalytic domain-containing protein [Verrucomicrobia bacterium]|nr:glycoside hydrolase family 97 catalytic domain-containing protein [Verrucomicrobiota bacterium]
MNPIVSFCVAAVGCQVFLLATDQAAAATETQVLSPDASVHFKLVAGDGRLAYAVSFRGQPVIEPSPLRFTVDGTALTEGVEFGEAKRSEVDEVYPWRGVHARATNRCRVAVIPIKPTRSGTAFTLEVRAFNDGVAFRCVIPAGDRPRVPDESTAFTLPAGSTVWFHDLGGHYEAVHKRKNVADVTAGEWAAPPVTFKLPGGAGFASLTEAALVNYPGMALQADGHRGFNLVLGHQHPISYPYRLRYSNDVARVSQPAAIAGAITTPWRVVLVGADLNALVNADVVHNLCAPPDPKLFPKGMATDWIKPGRAVWKYLDGGPSTFEGMKEFCRWAGELGFEHHVIEGFWRRWSDAELQELINYAQQRGVGIWLWRHTKELRDPDTRREFFQLCRKLGVAGVKLDFLDHEAKEIIDFYQVLLRETAENKLLVNFHGSNKPTGEPRPWPNELTREAVRGMEASRLRERAQHNATLPFTRFLAGHADYTPVHFGARRGDTTWAHQIASAAVFTSPLLTYGAHPTNLLNNPGVDMIKSIPAVWDETIVLPPSDIGEVAVFARRSGQRWFLAILNGPDARTIRIPLTFLSAGAYRAALVRDNKENPAAVQVETQEARRSVSLAVELSAGGGFIARFTEKR